MVFLVAALLLVALGFLLWRDRRRDILVDGSNVMWWKDDTPRLATLVAVLGALQGAGYAPRVIFDASAGHRLFGGWRNSAQMARALGLAPSRVVVVPRGEVADLALLELARARGLSIVTNDRYRDWAEAFPETVPARLVKGGFRGGKPWLALPGP